MKRTYRVVVAAPGPADGVGGTAAAARALRDRGFEVIDAGTGRTAGQVAATAVQEDADAVALVVPSGEGSGLVGATADELAARGIEDVPVFATDATHPDLGAWLEADLDGREP